MTRSWTPLRGVAVAFLGAALFVADVTAQRGPPPGGPPNRQQLELRVRERFAAMMKERLGLSAEQSDELGRTIESFQEQRQRLVSDEQALRRRTEAVLLERAPTEEEASSARRRRGSSRRSRKRSSRSSPPFSSCASTPCASSWGRGFSSFAGAWDPWARAARREGDRFPVRGGPTPRWSAPSTWGSTRDSGRRLTPEGGPQERTRRDRG